MNSVHCLQDRNKSLKENNEYLLDRVRQLEREREINAKLCEDQADVMAKQRMVIAKLKWALSLQTSDEEMKDYLNER